MNSPPTNGPELDARISKILNEVAGLRDRHPQAVPALERLIADVLRHEATSPSPKVSGKGPSFEVPESLSGSQVEAWIDNLPGVNAETRLMVSEFVGKTIEVGGRIIEIGKRIIEAVIALCKKYPNTAAGLFFAVLVWALVTSIPLIGSAIGVLVLPIALALGLIKGLAKDWQQKQEQEQECVDVARCLQAIRQDLKQLGA